MRAERSDRVMLEGDLRKAIERNEMRVLFNPVVRLDDRTVAGFETVLRWDHPKLGRIPAATFLPLAEECGLIVNLGIFALERTALELAAWQRSSKSSRRSSPPATCPRGSCCATTSCTM